MMREINECKVEVFRRSENRIKERRKRRSRIFALSTPLCLCAVLGIVVLSSPKKSADSSEPADGGFFESAGDVGGIKENEAVTEFSMVEIEKNSESVSQYVKETDVEKISNILDMIDDSFVSNEANTGSSQVEADSYAGGISQDVNSSSPEDSYIITVSENSSAQTVYSLAGNMFSNQTTNEKVVLTDEQYMSLRNEIDLLIDGEED